jgi:hypothetical protein
MRTCEEESGEGSTEYILNLIVIKNRRNDIYILTMPQLPKLIFADRESLMFVVDEY